MAANRENLSRPSLEIFRLCVQSVCPMFNVSSLKESQFQALYSLRFKAVFVGPEQNPKILQDVERGNFAFVYLSQRLPLQQKGGEICSKAKFIRRV